MLDTVIVVHEYSNLTQYGCKVLNCDIDDYQILVSSEGLLILRYICNNFKFGAAVKTTAIRY